MSDAASFFSPLNYTTSFTNPAGYNNAQLQNVFGQGQQTINDLFRSGGGFGQQTNYYSQLGANQLSGVVLKPLAPVGFYSGDNEGGTYLYHGPSMPSVTGGGGGGWLTQGGGATSFPGLGASPYQTSPNVWTQGASPFLGGGGSSGMGGSLYQNAPSIDWSQIGQAAAGLQAPSKSPFDFNAGMGGSMFGGLGGAGASPGAGLDWTKLFTGGGAKTADPYPNMAMPGGLNQPMVTPQQPPVDYGSLFGRGVGGTSGAPQTPQPAAPIPPEGKLSSLGGLGGAPYTPLPSGSSLDFTKLFTGGGGGEAQAAPAAPSTAPQTTPQTVPQAGDEAGGASFKERFSGVPVSAPPPPESGAIGANATPNQLIEQSRDKLAKLMTYDQPSLEQFRKGTPVVAETVPLPEARPTDATNPLEAIKEALPGEAGRGGMVGRPAEPAIEWKDGVPRPRAQAEEADAPRPQVALGTTTKELGYLPGRSAQDLKGVNPQVTKALKEFAQQYNSSQDQYDLVVRSGRLGRTEGQHARGNAVDVNLVDRRNGERLTDYQTRDPVVFKAYQDQANQFHQFLEKNYPDLAARHRWGGYFWDGGPPNYGSQDIMHHDFGGGSMGAGSWAGGLNQMAADAYELPYGGGSKTPWPKFNFDWSNAPIPDVGPMPLTYKSKGGGSVYQYDPATGQKVDVPVTHGYKKEMSELPGRPFVSAAPAAPSANVMRFGGGDFDSRAGIFPPGANRPEPGTPAWNEQVYQPFAGNLLMQRGPETGMGSFPDFRVSGNVEDRRSEVVGREELARLRAGGVGFDPWQLPETTEPNPLSAGLGLGSLPRAIGFAGGELAGPTPVAATPAGEPERDPRLAAQRSGYADIIRDDPDRALQLAARLNSEEQNNPATRVAILEAMLNRLNATGRDPLDLAYYPKNTKPYNDALERVSNNNALLGQIQQEMEQVFGGSNTSNFATDWASAAKADEERRYTTPTWISPTNEQFFLKDLNNPFTGSGIAAKNQKWYESVTSPFPR